MAFASIRDEPTVQDQKTDRGEFVYGRRTQSAKYFIQKEGDYTLPAIELKWWSLSTNRLVTATLPAVHFTATANANYIAELPPEQEVVPQPRHINPWIRYKFWIRVVVPCCIAALILLWIVWRYLPRIFRGLQAWREQRAHSETAYFRNLQFACRRNHAIQAYDWLLKWLTLAYPGMTIDEFLMLAADSDLSSETNHLGASLFSKNNQNAPWNGKRIAELLNKHRKTRNCYATQRQDLLKLNP